MEQNRQIYGDDLPVGHCRNRGSSGCSRHCLPCEAIGRICMGQNRQIYGDDLPVGHCRNRGSSGCSRHCLPCEAIGRSMSGSNSSAPASPMNTYNSASIENYSTGLCPVLVTVQSTVHFISWRSCSSEHQLDISRKHSVHHNYCMKTIHSFISTTGL